MIGVRAPVGGIENVSTAQSNADRCEPLYSTLADDPDTAELVALFVDELPQRLAVADALAHRADWESLDRLAHQLKGAAGSYGFPTLTDSAAALEQACRTDCEATVIRQALAALAETCGRARCRGAS